MKPSIRKQDGRWTLTRPGYGFNPSPTVRVFASWQAALTAALPSVASAGAQVERGAYTFRSGYWGPPRGTIRMEET